MGINRSVKAAPTILGKPARKGRQFRNQTLRKPFLSRIVVMVAVDTGDSVSTISRSNFIGFP
jgi:hypothetical protein